MNSKTLAQISQTPISTIRYYEQLGLIPQPPRLANGYRDYPAETSQLLNFIKLLASFDFSLKEIKSIFNQLKQDELDSSWVEERIENKLNDIRKKLAILEQLSQELSYLLKVGLDFPDLTLLEELNSIQQILQMKNRKIN